VKTTHNELGAILAAPAVEILPISGRNYSHPKNGNAI
jgi:hypothetical protein